MTPHSSFVAGRIGQELDLPHALAQVVEHRAGPFEQGAECRFDPLDQEEGREPDEAGPIGKPAPAIWHALASQITTNRPPLIVGGLPNPPTPPYGSPGSY